MAVKSGKNNPKIYCGMSDKADEASDISDELQLA